jgi:asparagine synthase (glutamine-hydrolysing)
MCGIAGFVTLDPRRVGRADLSAMNNALAHRGPDDEGMVTGDGIGLAHHRLAIIDLSSAGHQPMDGPAGTRITYNGEIYNFRELAAELAAFGLATQTRSDTEVLLLALHHWGLDALPRLNGMFAFGHWDPATRTMTLVRDRLGVKPLYYYADRSCLVFSSELRALEQWSHCPDDIDLEALDLYISYEHVPSPLTMFRGVRKLEPGCLLQWREGEWSVRRWWEVEFHEPMAADRRSMDDYAEECRHLLRRATQLRLISDAPLGALLSGGIDSSAVVALMADLGHVPETFSIGFDDASYNELEHARTVARHVGADHHEEILVCDPDHALAAVQASLDEPLADVSLIPTYMVSAMARRHVTVALSGDGGDEVFAGYDWYRAAQLADGYQRVPGAARRAADAMLRRIPDRPKKRGLVNTLKRFSQGANTDASLEHLRWQMFAGTSQKRLLYTSDLAGLTAGGAEAFGRSLLAAAHADEPLSRRQWVDLRLYLPDDINVKVDRASMAVALETRSPFLDVNVVEFAARLPARMRLDGGTRKAVLKRAIAPLVPASILQRSKEGFSIPMRRWLRGEMQPLMRDLLSSPGLTQWFDAGACRRLMDDHVSGRRNNAHLLWTLMVLELWRARTVSRSVARGAA